MSMNERQKRPRGALSAPYMLAFVAHQVTAGTLRSLTTPTYETRGGRGFAGRALTHIRADLGPSLAPTGCFMRPG